MSRKNSPKHSVGKGAQSEHHNEPDEKSYVKHPDDDNEEEEKDDEDYLKQKWEQVASDFNKHYGLSVDASEIKDESFSDTLKRLENKTGKSRADLKDEIQHWKK